MSLIPVVQAGHESDILVLTVSSTTSNLNVLTLATASGFSNDGTSPKQIQLNINSGVTVSGTGSSPAITTGALHATTTLTITNAGTVSSYTGSTSSTAGQAGGTGGNALEVNNAGTTQVTNTGTFGSGGGGGGGPGTGTTASEDMEIGGWFCDTGAENTFTGNAGAAGAAGQAGSAGTLHSYVFTGVALPHYGNCVTTAVGAGGAAGLAIQRNSNTVTTTGTFLGNIS